MKTLKTLLAALTLGFSLSLTSSAAPTTSTATLVAAASTPAVSTPQEEQRELKHWRLKKGLALEGYDPVAYFPEGGGKAKKGKKDISTKHEGVTYRFSSKKNLELFKKSPSKYEPAYGGWCAYAIAKKDKVAPSPKNFVIQDGRLMLFVKGLFGDAKKLWDKEGAKDLEKKADAYWKKLHQKKG